MYVTITGGAIARISAAFATASYLPLLQLSAALWIAAFGMFLILYGPFLASERVK
jgi:uncharacterized protein involved in response to NO